MKPLLFSIVLVALSLTGCSTIVAEPQERKVVRSDPFVLTSADKFINGFEHPIELANSLDMFVHLRESDKEAVVTLVTYPDGYFRIHSSRVATDPEIGLVVPEKLNASFFFTYPQGKQIVVFNGHTHPFGVINIESLSETRAKMMTERPIATGSFPPSINDVLIACQWLNREEFLSIGHKPIDHLDGVYDMNGLWLYKVNDSVSSQRCAEIARRLLPQRKSGLYENTERLVNEFGLTQAEAEWIQTHNQLQKEVFFVANKSQYQTAIDAYIENVAKWGVDMTYQHYGQGLNYQD